MKFKNTDAFFTDVKRKLLVSIEKDVVPVFKGVVMEATTRLVSGDGRYAGTPEWTGNAAANWWPSTSGPGGAFIEYFHDPAWPGAPSEYDGNEHQRAAAVELSLARVRLFLQELPGIPSTVYITNTAPYLLNYQPYGSGASGGSAPTFRLENLYPLSAMRAATALNAEVSAATTGQYNAWKAGFQ